MALAMAAGVGSVCSNNTMPLPRPSLSMSVSVSRVMARRGRRGEMESVCWRWKRSWRGMQQQQQHQVAFALVVEPSDSSASARENDVSDFVKRMERSWMISKQPRPVSCASCEASGRLECRWCKGTGFFILGDSMLCEVPSRNTKCRVCYGQVSKVFFFCDVEFCPHAVTSMLALGVFQRLSFVDAEFK
ncbi:hypothetical protein O6H91_Y426100 [Diphasiastrum complanatum]|nr:hypothetical protein O6H91_Y426100 [Diphasiastrum complanatum]